MVLLERLEEIDDGRRVTEMCDCLLRFYENGTRWPHGACRNDVTMPYTKRFDKQLATPGACITRRPSAWPQSCSTASLRTPGQDWPWEDVKPRLDEARSEMEQHIQAQRKRLRGKPRRRGVVDD